MPTKKKLKLKPNQKSCRAPSLGIIAGGGNLPAKLIESCDKKGIVPFIIGFDGQTDPNLITGRYHLWTRLGAAAQIIPTLQANGISEIILIGSIRRPSLDELRPDWKTAHLLTRIGLKAFGDDGLLKALRELLEEEGFTIKGIQDFVDDLVALEGTYGRHHPTKSQMHDIQKGIETCDQIGRLDIGQACVVQQGIVLAVEAIEGTDRMIRRAGELKRKGERPILVKMSKPGQDKSLDLPTIGPQTILEAHKAGFAGIVVEAGKTLVLHPQDITAAADKAGLFLIGHNGTTKIDPIT